MTVVFACIFVLNVCVLAQSLFSIFSCHSCYPPLSSASVQQRDASAPWQSGLDDGAVAWRFTSLEHNSVTVLSPNRRRRSVQHVRLYACGDVRVHRWVLQCPQKPRKWWKRHALSHPLCDDLSHPYPTLTDRSHLQLLLVDASRPLTWCQSPHPGQLFPWRPPPPQAAPRTAHHPAGQMAAL